LNMLNCCIPEEDMTQEYGRIEISYHLSARSFSSSATGSTFVMGDNSWYS
jgi:hypothetical protein